jgi:hypothetical protein
MDATETRNPQATTPRAEVPHPRMLEGHLDVPGRLIPRVELADHGQRAKHVPSTVPPILTLTGALHDDALADITHLHLVSLLATDRWCRFVYLRGALDLSECRLKRHFFVLRDSGYVATTRDEVGVGWACLTELGARRRATQFATLLDLLPVAREHAHGARAARPDWFVPVARP